MQCFDGHLRKGWRQNARHAPILHLHPSKQVAPFVRRRHQQHRATHLRASGRLEPFHRPLPYRSVSLLRDETASNAGHSSGEGHQASHSCRENQPYRTNEPSLERSGGPLARSSASGQSARHRLLNSRSPAALRVAGDDTIQPRAETERTASPARSRPSSPRLPSRDRRSSSPARGPTPGASARRPCNTPAPSPRRSCR